MMSTDLSRSDDMLSREAVTLRCLGLLRSLAQQIDLEAQEQRSVDQALAALTGAARRQYRAFLAVRRSEDAARPCVGRPGEVA